ncbi:Leucine-rich repeat domain, L domain-like [Phytophthora cactorum]|nr:Leucine-rich repeat domain, L domain-like [Phytophthora cactorum]
MMKPTKIRRIRYYSSNPLATLEAIQYLDLNASTLETYCNRLQTLPTGVGNLPKLQRLDIATNKLKTLPSSSQQQVLAYLDRMLASVKLFEACITKNRDLRGLLPVFAPALLVELRVDKSCFLALEEEADCVLSRARFFSAE